MFTRRALINCALALALVPALASSALAFKVGDAAPAFSATDSKGKVHTQDSHKGKFVVLEWMNHGCPYVRKHYDSQNMQTLQGEWTGKGVVWLSVISSAPGKQGYSDPAQAEADYAKYGSKATAVLLDPEGKMGRTYGAKSTPQMVIIDPAGKVIYSGGIDDKATTDQADIQTATNYVAKALREATAGKPVSTPLSQPYGCSVKYAAQ